MKMFEHLEKHDYRDYIDKIWNTSYFCVWQVA